MARPPEQAIDETIAALRHFGLPELGAAVNDLREELETECALADELGAMLHAVIASTGETGTVRRATKLLDGWHERRDA